MYLIHDLVTTAPCTASHPSLSRVKAACSQNRFSDRTEIGSFTPFCCTVSACLEVGWEGASCSSWGTVCLGTSVYSKKMKTRGWNKSKVVRAFALRAAKFDP